MYHLLSWGLTVEQNNQIETSLWLDQPIEVITSLPGWKTPSDVLLLVGDQANQFEFIFWCQEQTKKQGVLPQPVLLYLFSETPDPEQWHYHDGFITDTDLSRLEMLLECPFILDTEKFAVSVPATTLHEFTPRPVDSASHFMLDLPQFQLSHHSWLSDHLKTCAFCRLAFEDQIEMRFAFAKNLTGTQSEPLLQLWLAQSVSSQMETAPLEDRRLVVWRTVLEAMTPALEQWRTHSNPFAELIRESFGPLLNNVLGVGQEYLLKKGWNRPILALYAALRQGITIPVKSATGYFRVQSVNDTLVFSTTKQNFRFQLLVHDHSALPLLSIDSQNGQVILPLANFNQTLLQGACRLVILPLN